MTEKLLEWDDTDPVASWARGPSGSKYVVWRYVSTGYVTLSGDVPCVSRHESEAHAKARAEHLERDRLP